MPLDFDPPFCPRRVLMSANDRAINAVLLPINLAFGIGLLLQRFQHPLPYSCLHPSIKAVGDRLPRPISLRQVSPRRSRSHNPENPIQNQSMIVCWTTHRWFLRWQQGSQLLPLLIRQFSSFHAPFYRHLAICEQALGWTRPEGWYVVTALVTIAVTALFA